MIVRAGLGRYRGMRGRAWRGMGYVSPVGFADENSFQAAVIASFPTCPPPYDPACEGTRDAQISANLNEWVTNPQSCHNIVCNTSGTPAIAAQPSGGIGYNTTSGFVFVQPQPAQVATPTSAPTAPNPVSPRGPRPVPFQSASPSMAPGGTAASSNAPTPVQTQTAPVDTAMNPIILASSCTAGQSYVAPGAAYQYPPYVGQIAYNGACETIPTGTTASATDFLSSIPIWGWALAGLGVILLTRGGKR